MTSPVQFLGSASDDVGVGRVNITIRDRDTNLYLGNNGTWGSVQKFAASLATPGGRTTDWSLALSIPACDCVVNAVSRDAAGNLSAPSNVFFGVAKASPTSPPFLTLLFGQSMWTTAVNCSALDSFTLMDVAVELQARGLPATASVVIDNTNETSRLCVKKVRLMASWADIATLRDSYGWTFVSNAVTRRNITTLSADEQYAESCGSLQSLYDHGHLRSKGLFAYTANQYSTAVQEYPVSSCFSFGRRYLEGRTLKDRTGFPWFQKTTFGQGGSCNDPTLSCYSTNPSSRYFPVDSLRNLTQVNGDEWVTLQFFRFVTGSGSAGIFKWDCTATDWRAHWTNDSELYCWDDFRAVLDEIPSGDVVTDPLTVAEAWGRTLN